MIKSTLAQYIDDLEEVLKRELAANEDLFHQIRDLELELELTREENYRLAQRLGLTEEGK